MKCRECETELDGEARFCGKCGSPAVMDQLVEPQAREKVAPAPGSAVDMTGVILKQLTWDASDAAGSGERQDFFLFRDESTGIRYPVYIISGAIKTKKTAVALTEAYRARIVGKFKKVRVMNPAGREIIGASDVEAKETTFRLVAQAIVPKQVEVLDGAGGHAEPPPAYNP